MNELNELFREHPFHGLAYIFPVMNRQEFAGLVDSKVMPVPGPCRGD